MNLEPGITYLARYLAPDAQREFWAECRRLADGPVPMYTPTVRGGRRMSVGMLCLGRHWNGLQYIVRGHQVRLRPAAGTADSEGLRNARAGRRCSSRL